MSRLRWISNLLWPPRCVFCGAFLPLKTPADACYCEACVAENRPALSVRCAKCAHLLVALAGEWYCPHCDAKRIYFDGMIAPFYYEKQVRSSIIRYKFRHRTSYAKTYATFMAERFWDTPEFSEVSCVCAVPVWKWNAFRAGEDRSRHFAKAVGKTLSLPVLKQGLVQVRKTKKQKNLSAQERIKNVRGAYAVLNPERVCDAVVLLLDDVYTTGSTVNECAKVLKHAGAKAVYVLTIAQRQ